MKGGNIQVISVPRVTDSLVFELKTFSINNLIPCNNAHNII